MADRIHGFISYSHEDEALYKELRKHLEILDDSAIFWDDQEIMAGENWNDAILENLQTAHIILLLISVDFIASKYIKTIEVKKAMERSARGEAYVIPVILRTVDWETMPYHPLQALPRGGKPVVNWSRKDDAFTDVLRGIREVIKKLEENQAQPAAATISQKRIPVDTLQMALLSLNYREQANAFRKVIGNKVHVGAFLIHGEIDYGQSWLLHRLLSNKAIENVNKPPFKFRLTNTSAGRKLGRLWFSLGKWLDNENSQTLPEAIVEQVYRSWQKQSMIFVLSDIDGATEQYLQEFLRDFWEPLIDIINRNSQAQEPPDHYLLLFLVDNLGNVQEWNIRWEEQLDTFDVPVKLKRLQDFTDKDVEDWIENEMDRYGLPSTLTPQEILAQGGVPVTVLQQIYKICGYELYEHESAW